MKFKIRRRKFRLCLRDECGTRICDQGRDDEAAMLRTTLLGREVGLIEDMAMTTIYFHELKKMGMLRWKYYKEHRDSIIASLEIVNQRIKTYKERTCKTELELICTLGNQPIRCLRMHLAPCIQPCIVFCICL
jgi:hypothetical protein